MSARGKAGAAVAAFVVFAAVSGGHGHHHGNPFAVLDSLGAAPMPADASTAIGYAKDQLGKPYCWGGTGPSCYDCSGLVEQAEAAAGLSIPRTSQAQWAQLQHVSSPGPGDLAFFAGSDGTITSPGHDALVVGRHGGIIEAYGTGVPIRYSNYHRPDLVGFARP